MLKGKFFKKISVWTVVLPFLMLFFLYILYYSERIYPNTFVAGVSVGGLTPASSAKLLSQKVSPQKIVLTSQEQSFEIVPEKIDLVYDLSASVQTVYLLDRTGNIVSDFKNRVLAVFKTRETGLQYNFDEKKLNQILSVVAGQVETDPVYPSVKVLRGKVTIDKGKKGQTIDIQSLRKSISQSLQSATLATIQIPLNTQDPTLTESEADQYKTRVEKIAGKSLNITFEFQSFVQKADGLYSLLDPKGGYSQEKINALVSNIKSQVDRDPQNPTFVFSEGKVKEFAPAKDGAKTLEGELKAKILEVLGGLENQDSKEISFEVPVEKTASEIQTSEVNDLGIKELIGRGTSRFRGSIASRIYNITLAASRLNGILIKPGDTLSFNDALGDVSKFTGYKEAYIIKDGKTILGDGGGVCQVSTTLFRAVLNAGLPIVERRAHSYRVGYYEQDSSPGFDATVYSPTTDLKIKNDTPAHILIQTQVNPKNSTLVFELYGTRDGRVATTTKPTVSDSVEPPPDLYQDDPTLPSGTVKQIDYRAWGAKATFNYKVERGGETIYQKTFISNYRPWQAVYLRGTAPVQ